MITLNLLVSITNIALVILVIIIALILILGFFISKSIFQPKRFGYERTKEIEIENKFYDENFLSNYMIEDVHTTSNKLSLHAHLINQSSDKTIIIMHGHTYTLYGSYKYASLFLKKGYNVLMPDQRYHGLSEGENCTLGYREKDDLLKWIEYIKEVIPESKTLGLHGESMGAATVLLGGHHPDVNFIIEDCSFSDLKTETTDILKKSVKLPKLMVYPTHLMSVLLYKAPLLKVNPIKNLKNIKAPILFIHGDNDNFIDITHFYSLTSLKKDIDSTYICQGADHAQSYQTNRKLYEETVSKFLSKNQI